MKREVGTIILILATVFGLFLFVSWALKQDTYKEPYYRWKLENGSVIEARDPRPDSDSMGMNFLFTRDGKRYFAQKNVVLLGEAK